MMQQDWHPADIIAALKKQGTSLAAVSRKAGLASGTLANALRSHWPKGERLIAEALNISPAQIWPSRYRRADCTVSESQHPPHYSMTELLAQCDPFAEMSNDEREWVDAPAAGKEIL
ncbi:Antitoxin PemI [Escherichia coli]|nr:Antitoxin PemI [Escherichia coli]RDP97354.1 Antitoxin PemI [Escherichia coli]RDQ28739.1 Antitoxin PemI [Escherichia coli]RDQ34390.1 Antitoxin PemI [Escherichia coli]RDQ49189.1 Antitoxin PemI [Escherichia coli]